jgi:hypothetical protein
MEMQKYLETVDQLKNRIKHYEDGMVTFDEMITFLLNDITSQEVQTLVEESRKANEQYDQNDDGSD